MAFICDLVLHYMRRINHHRSYHRHALRRLTQCVHVAFPWNMSSDKHNSLGCHRQHVSLYLLADFSLRHLKVVLGLQSDPELRCGAEEA
jgi:hypothetical protein